MGPYSRKQDANQEPKPEFCGAGEDRRAVLEMTAGIATRLWLVARCNKQPLWGRRRQLLNLPGTEKVQLCGLPSTDVQAQPAEQTLM